MTIPCQNEKKKEMLIWLYMTLALCQYCMHNSKHLLFIVKQYSYLYYSNVKFFCFSCRHFILQQCFFSPHTFNSIYYTNQAVIGLTCLISQCALLSWKNTRLFLKIAAGLILWKYKAIHPRSKCSIGDFLEVML